MANSFILLARPARLERATCGFVVRHSIHLSYGRAFFYGLPFEALATNYASREASLVK